MSDPILDYQSAPIIPAGMPTAEATLKAPKEAATSPEGIVTVSGAGDAGAGDVYDGAEGIPTEEELSTLRLVSAPIS